MQTPTLIMSNMWKLLLSFSAAETICCTNWEQILIEKTLININQMLWEASCMCSIKINCNQFPMQNSLHRRYNHSVNISSLQTAQKWLSNLREILIKPYGLMPETWRSHFKAWYLFWVAYKSSAFSSVYNNFLFGEFTYSNDEFTFSGAGLCPQNTVLIQNIWNV